MNYVLRPLKRNELNKFFDDKSKIILDYFIKKSLFSQPERIKGQNKLPIQIPKENIEQWLVQSLGIDGIGAGSYALDVINREKKWGADVKMLSTKVDNNGNLKNNYTGETSLAQKFKETGSNLDTLFKNKDFEVIKSEWLGIYGKKLNDVKKENDLNNIYYFILIRGGNRLYLLGMEILLENLKNTKVDIERTDKKGTQSVFINGFLDEKYGYTKIYKAKKRLELRLKAKEWNDNNLCLVFDLDIDIEEINFLELLENENFDINKYGLEKAKNIFNKKSM